MSKWIFLLNVKLINIMEYNLWSKMKIKFVNNKYKYMAFIRNTIEIHIKDDNFFFKYDRNVAQNWISFKVVENIIKIAQNYSLRLI